MIIHSLRGQLHKTSKRNRLLASFFALSSLHKIYCNNNLQQFLNRFYLNSVLFIKKIKQGFYILLHKNFLITVK